MQLAITEYLASRVCHVSLQLLSVVPGYLSTRYPGGKCAYCHCQNSVNTFQVFFVFSYQIKK